jgi:vacuolar-type H+-ATPase subunit F/Vma7
VTCAAAIGEDVRVGGYGLAGVEVHAAEDGDAARAAWAALPADVACLILTPAAHAALGARLGERPGIVWTVLPR